MFYYGRRKIPINQYISRYMEILERRIKEPLSEAKKRQSLYQMKHSFWQHDQMQHPDEFSVTCCKQVQGLKYKHDVMAA